MFKFLSNIIDSKRRDNSLTGRFRRLIPFLGTSESFLKALHRYQLGRLQDNQSEIEAARVEGLVAMMATAIEVGLFLSVFGKAAALSGQVARGALFSLQGSRVAREFSVNELDYLEPVAEKMLADSTVRKSMDAVFESARITLLSTVKKMNNNS